MWLTPALQSRGVCVKVWLSIGSPISKACTMKGLEGCHYVFFSHPDRFLNLHYGLGWKTGFRRQYSSYTRHDSDIQKHLIIVAADKCGCNKYQHPVVPVFDRTKPVCWRFSVCQGIGVKCKNENKNSRDPFKGACGGMFPGFSSSGVFHLFTRRIVLVYFTIFLHLVISSVSHCGFTGRHSLEN